MAKMKVFSLGNHGFVGSAVIRALSEPEHVRQARVLIVAPNKSAAIQVAEDRRNLTNISSGEYTATPTMSDPEFRVATGYDVDALRVAGLCDQPAIFVMPLDAWRCPVVRVDTDGVRQVGRLYGHEFIANATEG